MGWCENVKLTVSVTNPSATKRTAVPVKTYLPRGAKPDDVVDSAGFDVEYDFGSSLYYIAGEVTLDPGQKRDIAILIRDVWRIEPEGIEALRRQTETILGSLKKTDYYAKARVIAQNVYEKLDAILASQDTLDVAVDRRISVNGANLIILRDVRKDVGVLEDLVLDKSDLVHREDKDRDNGDLAANKIPSTDETAGKSTATVKFRVEISNPLSKEAVVPARFTLPEEVRSESVVNTGGLDLSYDSQKNLYCLEKKDSKLLPGEKKEFVVEIRDVWFIAQSRLDILRARTEKMLKAFPASPKSVLMSSTVRVYDGVVALYRITEDDKIVFEREVNKGESAKIVVDRRGRRGGGVIASLREAAEALGNKIFEALNNIGKTQNDRGVSVERHIGYHRLNLVRFDEARRNATKLEWLLVQAQGLMNATPVAKEVKKIEEKEKIKLAAKMVFQGKAPSTATSWQAILIIVSFLGVVGFLFFILWWGQVKNAEKEKKEKIE